jgi:predicted nucleic acid-binding protein
VIVLDSSAVIAAFYSSDAHHEMAVTLLDRHAAGGFLVHPITLAESLVGAARSGRINQARTQMRNMGIEVYSPDSEEPLLIAEIRANTGLKLPDCCVLAASLVLTAPLMTFDDKLRSSARAQSVGVVDAAS